MNKVLSIVVGFSPQARTWVISALSERNCALYCDAPSIVANQAEVLSYHATFPEADVQLTPRIDYRYRARIDRETVVQAMASAIRSITYGNFKGPVRTRSARRLHGGVERHARLPTAELPSASFIGTSSSKSGTSSGFEPQAFSDLASCMTDPHRPSPNRAGTQGSCASV